MSLGQNARDAYLEASREEAVRYIAGLVPQVEQPAYRAVLDYPLRAAKGLRPALAIAMCRTLGGGLAEIVPTAAALELCHNAFLVHDDIEDGSEMRRGKPTLAKQLGTAMAIHTGDTMLAMVLQPLLDNMALLDMGRALRLLELFARMMRETAEGQALELSWIRECRWDVSEADYLEMVTKKTSWYSFAVPLVAGGIVANASESVLTALQSFGLDLGVAFQIRDDVLNLVGAEADTGKECDGDLWEGKRTLVLSHFFETGKACDIERAKMLLEKQRPSELSTDAREMLRTTLEHLQREGMTHESLEQVRIAFSASRAATTKDAEGVLALRALLEPSIEYATSIARDFASRAHDRWTTLHREFGTSQHTEFIRSIVDYVTQRTE